MNKSASDRYVVAYPYRTLYFIRGKKNIIAKCLSDHYTGNVLMVLKHVMQFL